MGDPPCANFLQRQIFQQYCLKSTIRYTKVSTNLSYRRIWILINLLPYRFNCVLLLTGFGAPDRCSSSTASLPLANSLAQNESVVCPHRAVTLQKIESLIFFLCFHIFRFSSDVTASEWWSVVLGFNGPLRQYFSLYRAVSQREGERGKKG